MAKAFLYGRHSSDKQGMTQDLQRDLCLKYYESVLKPKGVDFAGWFYDPAVTSAIELGEREYGRIVVTSAQPGDYVVVAKLSRSFRKNLDMERTTEMLQLRGVTFISLDMPIDTSRAHGRFTRRVYGAADQLIREIAVEHQNELASFRKEQGLPHSRGCPVGWRVIGKKPNREYRVDMQERALADAIAALYANGASLEEIALWGFRQKRYENKRTFTTRDTVKWVLNARAKGYPKVTGYKNLRKQIRLGQI
jgi:DNA invertase Pin-like site-specific DNA recombinase